MNKTSSKYYDRQNFLELACIQSVSLGGGVIIMGNELCTQYGAGTAISSIIIGNMILWLLAISMILMVDRTRFNAIDNISHYLGKYGGIIAACIFLFAFLNRYTAQINFSMEELNHVFSLDTHHDRSIFIKWGAGLGFFTALLSIGGIRLLKKITVLSLFPLFAYYFYSMYTSHEPISLKGTWGVSFSAILSSILVLLPGVINLPTFFRHSRSKPHSILALTLIVILVSFFEIFTIWMKFSNFANFYTEIFLFSTFIILLQLCCNFLNIYLASACWEALVSDFEGPKKFAILGLFGTLVFTFVQITAPIQFLQNLTTSYIATLGMALLMAYLTRILVRHRPRVFEKTINVMAWVFGCSVSTYYELIYFPDSTQPALAGMLACVLFFMAVIFIEETGWAVRMKMKMKRIHER